MIDSKLGLRKAINLHLTFRKSPERLKEMSIISWDQDYLLLLESGALEPGVAVYRTTPALKYGIIGLS